MSQSEVICTSDHGYVHALATKCLIGSKIRFSQIAVEATENWIIAASFAKGVTVLNSCEVEPEIKQLYSLQS